MDLIPQSIVALRWNAIVRVLGQLITWSITLVVARLLSPADYGLLAMAVVFVEYIAILADMGLSTAIIQAPEIDRRKLRQILGVALLISLAASLVALAGSGAITRFYREPRLAPIIGMLSIQFLLNGLMAVPRGLAQRSLDFKRFSLIQLAGAITGALTTLGLAGAGKGVWSLVTGNLVNLAVQVVAANILWPFRHWPLFSIDSARQMISFGASVSGVGVLWLLWTSSDVWIAGRLLGKELLGAYSVGMQIASMPVSRFGQIVTQVAFPAFSRLQDDPEARQRNLTQSVRILSLAIFPVCWGLSAVAPELILAVIGERWAGAIVPLRVLALIMPLRMVGLFTASVVRSAGRADIDLHNTLLAILVMPPAFFAGCHWGLGGLSLAWAAVYPGLFVWNMRNYLAVLGLPFSSLPRFLGVPAVAGACMFAATFLLRWWFRPWQTHFGGLVALCTVGAAVYCAVAWRLDRAAVVASGRFVQTVLGLGRHPAPKNTNTL
jgi:O-antigen/teichoic acid export membrane protein